MEHPTIAKAASSSFDFTPLSQSFPLSISLSKDDQDLETNMGLFEGLSIIIGMSIGSGIFASPGPVLGYTESVGAALSVWLIAGLLALTGSLCYAELGTMYPISGGEHPYLLKAYGTLPAFLFSWTGVVCTRPGSIAIITMIFAEYVVRLIYYGHPGGVAPVWLTRLIAALCIAVLTLLNCLSTRLGTWVQNIFTSLKLVSLLVIGGIGCVILAEGASKSHNYDREPFQGSSTNPGDYALALYSALWAYDGWNNLNIVTGELRNPTRTLPQATIAGPLIIMVCYLLTNLAYYAVLPEDVIVKSASVAMDFGKNVFGHVGGIIIPIIVIGSTFGAANGSVFTSARVLMASAKHGDIPPVFAQVHPRFKTPLNALVIQGLISVFFVSVGSFTSLVTFYSMIAWTFYLLAVLGLLLLRYRAPNLERPFRVWIIVPVIFCASTLFLIVFSVMEAPKEALAAFLFFASGVPIWYAGEVLGMTWERKYCTVAAIICVGLPVPRVVYNTCPGPGNTL
ncbi:amino acid/polyamine transporter I [Polychytrium aggregatum]|uniref:amino acid/polyamine transporter I n=1 Tax=Polychytrium aggregatum TaxID=110093 RepID=UPI0022FE61FC|nr:amino acid/polyamine transporter I [Polychytrium aggregatum]KAI9193602.1 amino acid/polyamine transporter I [Polychytrium aggregatum]